MKKKIHIINILKTFLYLFLLSPFFKMTSISYLFPEWEILFTGAKILSFLIIIFLYVFDHKFNKILIYILMYLLVLLLSSYLNPLLSFFDSIMSVMSVIALCMITDYGIRHDLKILLNALLIILFNLAVLNLYTIIRYPDGLYINNDGFSLNWVLGYKNSLILYLLPLIIFSTLRSLIYKNKIDLFVIICFLLSFISIVIVNSSTGIIGLIIILIFYIFNKFFCNTDIFNVRSYFVIYLITFISIIILRVQKLASFIIVDLLHKDLTFTGRTYIWDNVFEYIKMKPILGYGNQTYHYNSYIVTTHNSILDILYRSGVVGILVYAFLIIIVLHKLFKNRRHKIAMFLSIALFAYFVMMFMEAFNISYYFYILVFCYNVEYLIDEANKHIRKDVK